MNRSRKQLQIYVNMLEEAAQQKERDLSMSITSRYETDIQVYLGYDQMALWLVIEDLMWQHFLQDIGYVNTSLPRKDVLPLFMEITTSKQDIVEKAGIGPEKLGKGHDVLALLQLMYALMPQNSWLRHFCKTSYDKLCTGHALMHVTAYRKKIKPALLKLDEVWRAKILEFSELVQMFRTHFQDALPGVVGMWLAVLHDRFQGTAEKINLACGEITGKATGAVGTSAAYRAMRIIDCYDKSRFSRKTPSYEEHFLCNMLGLGKPRLSTQIVQQENLTRYFFELVMLSGSLANLGEDTRILQGSALGELTTVSSTSSTMAHKDANPVGAENLRGMQTTVIGEFMKPLQNQVSLLQRDLTGSGPARDYVAIPAYVYRQISNATKLLESMAVNKERCIENFSRNRLLVMGELLHLSLCRAGMPESHVFVNKKVVPEAKRTCSSLVAVMDVIADKYPNVRSYWNMVNDEIKQVMFNPEEYTGLAVMTAKTQSKKVLTL